jgi:hypothetical protein
MATGTSTDSNSATTSNSAGLWTIAVIIACGLAWVGYTFPPKQWVIPDDMSHIGALSSEADKARLAAVVNSNLWNNTFLKFSLAGLGIGTAGVVLCIPKIGKKWPMALGMLICGVASGLLAGSIGLIVRQYLDLDHPIPLISQEARPLFCDSVVFSVLSILLLLPVSLYLILQPAKSDRHKATSVPLAGLITGLVVPFTGALFLPSTVTTGLYPPRDWQVTVLWFATLAVTTLIVCVFMGSRNPQPKLDSKLGDA